MTEFDVLAGSLAEKMADNMVPMVLFPLCVFAIFILHEAGHYLAARLFGVRVLSFDIGFGPLLFRRTDRRGTVWSCHLVPFSGLVQLAGPRAAAGTIAMPQTQDMFIARPVWQRAVIVAAGPAMNIALAVGLLLLFFTGGGIPTTHTVLSGVGTDTPAAAAGLRAGDVITAIDGTPVSRSQQVIAIIRDNEDKELSFSMTRDGRPFTVTLRPVMEDCYNARGFACRRPQVGILMSGAALDPVRILAVDGIETGADADRARDLLRERAGQETEIAMERNATERGLYRIIPLPDTAQPDEKKIAITGGQGAYFATVGVREAVTEALRQTVRMATGTAYVAVQMWPVDRSRFAMEVRVPRAVDPVRYDLYTVLYIAALMSVFVAFFNMLPVPRLDGGALILLAVEAVAGARRAHTIAPYIARGALVIFLGVLAFAHAGDIVTVLAQRS